MLSSRNFLGEDFEFGEKNRGLQRIHAAIDSDTRVMIAARLAMNADLAHGIGEFLIICETCSTVAVASEWFGWEEAGASDGGEVAGSASLVGCAEALCSIFDNGDVVSCCDLVDCVHIGALTIERDRKNCFCFLRDDRFKMLRIEIVGPGVNVHIHRLGTEKRNDLDRSDESERRGDDLVAGTNPNRHECEQQRVSAAGTGDAVATAGKGSELLLQLPNFRAHDVLGMIEDTLDARVDAAFEIAVLRLEVDELHQLPPTMRKSPAWISGCSLPIMRQAAFMTLKRVPHASQTMKPWRLRSLMPHWQTHPTCFAGLPT